MKLSELIKELLSKVNPNRDSDVEMSIDHIGSEYTTNIESDIKSVSVQDGKIVLWGMD